MVKLELKTPSDLSFLSLAKAMDMIIEEKLKAQNLEIGSWELFISRKDNTKDILTLAKAANCKLFIETSYKDFEWSVRCGDYETHSEGA